MDLEAIKQIEQLKHRYSRALDTKSWEEFADTMVPEVKATYSEYLTFDSRDSFVSFLENTLGTHVITEHQCGQPEITVTGDTAVGVWFLADTTLIPEDGMLLRGRPTITTVTSGARTGRGGSRPRGTSARGNPWLPCRTSRVSG